MGIKRKASDFEEQPVFHQPSSPPSMTTDSAESRQSTPSSMNTEPYHMPTCFDHEWDSRKETPYWLSTRTKKRLRDNRPSEEKVTEDTIRKLFQAQRQPHAEPEVDLSMDLDKDVAEDDHEGWSRGQHEEEDTVVALEPEPNQRSIYDFFGARQGEKKPQIIASFLSPPIVRQPDTTASPTSPNNDVIYGSFDALKAEGEHTASRSILENWLQSSEPSTFETRTTVDDADDMVL